MAVRVQLKKKWKNWQGREYKAGEILQFIPSLASELIADQIGDFYNGNYPPKKEDKLKIELSQLNNK